MPPKTPNTFQFRDSRERSFVNGTKVPTTRIVRKWEHDLPSIASLVDNGFYYTPTRKNQDQVTCFWCGKKENNIVGVRAVAGHHLRSSPRCAYGLIQSNMELYVSAQNKEQYWERLADDGGAPKAVTDPHCKQSIELRVSTFKDLWKLDSREKCTATSRDLAKAGLYYSPLDQDNDRVICMYCDCPLDHWDPEDDPLHEHKENAYAYCYFLQTLQSGKEKSSRKQNKMELPDDSIDEIDESQASLEADAKSSTPKPTENGQRGHESSFSSPLNETIPQWPSPSPSPAPELHKTSEFDSYDFSIEDIEDPDHNSIFDGGKNRIYKRKPATRKKLPPPPSPLRKKIQKEAANRSSFVMQVNDSHAKESKVEENEEEKSNNSMEAGEAEHANSIEVVESSQSIIPDDVSDQSSEEDYDHGDDDVSYHDDTHDQSSERSVEKGIKRKHDSGSGDEDDKSTINDSNRSMDSDRFRQILASPGKSKKVKLQHGEGSLKIKDDLLDLSGHNIDDFDESNISYFESKGRTKRRSSETKDSSFMTNRSVLSTKNSVKVRKSAFDDDDDDFNFFAHQPKKEKPKEKVTEKDDLVVVKSATGEAATTEASESKDESKGDEGRRLSESKTAEKIVEEEANPPLATEMGADPAEEASATRDSDPVVSTLSKPDVDETVSLAKEPENTTADAMDVDSEQKKDVAVETGEKDEEEKVGVNNDKAESIDSKEIKEKTTEEENNGDKVGEKEIEKSSFTPEETEHTAVSNGPLAEREAGSHPASKDSSREISKDTFVDTRTDFEERERTAEQSIGESADEVDADADADDTENGFDDKSDFSLSPSSYGEYVKDMRSMEEEFVDASAIQDTRDVNLLIEKSSKTYLLESVTEEKPSTVENMQDLVLFDDRDQEVRRVSTKPEFSHQFDDNIKESSPLVVDVRNAASHIEKEEKELNINSVAALSSDAPMKDEKSQFDHSTHSADTDENEIDKESAYEGNETKAPSSPAQAESSLQPSSSPRKANHSRNNSVFRSEDESRKSPSLAPTNQQLVIYPLDAPASEGIQMSSPAYNESPHNRTFIADSSSMLEGDVTPNPGLSPVKAVDESPPLAGLERARSESFIEASTPQKKNAEPNGDAPHKLFPKIDITTLGNIDEELRTLKDTMEYLSEAASANCELHNDTEGILTDFIAAMPEEEEMMTIKEWMEHNAATCGRTVRAIADRMIDVYESEFEKLIQHVEQLPTSD